MEEQLAKTLKLPENLRQTPDAKFLYNFGCVTTMDIVELIYRPTESQGYSRDYEVGRNTMRGRWAQQLSDADSTLLASPWLSPMPPDFRRAAGSPRQGSPRAGGITEL